MHNEEVHEHLLGYCEYDECDEMPLCSGVPFVVAWKTLGLDGKTANFYIVTDIDGQSSVHSLNI